MLGALNWLAIDIAAAIYNAVLLVGPLVLAAFWYERSRRQLCNWLDRFAESRPDVTAAELAAMQLASKRRAVKHAIALGVTAQLVAAWLLFNGHAIVRRAYEHRADISSADGSGPS